MSDALNEFLKIHLGFEKPLPATGGLGKEEIEALIEEECEIRLREIKEDIASRLPSIPEIIAKAEAQAQSWMDRNSEEWMHRLGEQFYKRIYTLERKVQTIDWWLSREETGIYQPLEPEEEPPLSSLEQEDAEANPLPIPCQSPLPLEGLKQSELERRLKIAKGTLTKRRNRDDFKEWSREKDPDKIAWQWDAIARKYLAVE